jgi:isopenicillin-N epimerase
MPTAADMRDEFLLDPAVTFLSHGTFGACPRPVFERYQAWQLELEREPVDFIARRLPGLLAEARGALARFVGARAVDLTFVQNATTGVSMAARSLDLRPGDEVLATSLEYGGCDLGWEWLCARTGARYVRADVPLPIARAEDVVEALYAQRSGRTRAVFVSHVTSATALRLPVEAIVARARAEGLVSIVDGAHAPSQVPLDLDALGADFYAGNCHKWLCAPKGAGFLHVRPERQDRIDGAIVSWGYREPATFLSRTAQQGTRDDAAYLSVPDAIAFQHDRDWDAVRSRCRALALEARDELCALFGTEPIAAPELIAQMASVRLPADQDGAALERGLWDGHRIEIPTLRAERDLLRISVACYTSREDVERLLDALPGVLRTSRSPRSG